MGGPLPSHETGGMRLTARLADWSHQLPLDAREQIRIAVICPTTGSRGRFHPRLYQNFTSQTYRNKELVVIDTSEEPSSFWASVVARDHRVRYKRFEPRKSIWIGLKRNIAVHLSAGDVIAHFDDDDFYAPDYLITMLAGLIQAQAHCVTLAAWHIFDEVTRVAGLCDSQLDLPTQSSDGVSFGYGFSYLFRRDSWQLAPFPDCSMGEDYHWVRRMRFLGLRVELVRTEPPLCLHMQHGLNTTSSFAQHIPLAVLRRTPVGRMPEVAELLVGAEDTSEREAAAICPHIRSHTAAVRCCVLRGLQELARPGRSRTAAAVVSELDHLGAKEGLLHAGAGLTAEVLAGMGIPDAPSGWVAEVRQQLAWADSAFWGGADWSHEITPVVVAWDLAGMDATGASSCSWEPGRCFVRGPPRCEPGDRCAAGLLAPQLRATRPCGEDTERAALMAAARAILRTGGCHLRGEVTSRRYRVNFMCNGVHLSPWYDIPLKNGDGSYNFICEIPKWTRKRFEIFTGEPMNPIKQDVKNGVLREYKWGDMLFNYGAFPQTWEDPKHVSPETGCPGDNDPIDVIELGTRQRPVGSITSVKIVGVIAMIDGDETDWKVLAIANDDDRAQHINDLQDLDAHMPSVTAAITHWLRMYKTADGKPKNKFGCGGKPQSARFATKIVQECHESWRQLIAESAKEGKVKKVASGSDLFTDLTV